MNLINCFNGQNGPIKINRLFAVPIDTQSRTLKWLNVSDSTTGPVGL